MTELQEIRTNAMYLEQQLLDVAVGLPQLQELLGPEFFKTAPNAEPVDCLQQYILLGWVRELIE